MRTWSPSRSALLAHRRSSLTNVPFVEPRSGDPVLTSPSNVMRAWWRLMLSWSMKRSLLRRAADLERRRAELHALAELGAVDDDDARVARPAPGPAACSVMRVTRVRSESRGPRSGFYSEPGQCAAEKRPGFAVCGVYER